MNNLNHNMADSLVFDTMNAGQLADILQNNSEKVVVIDSRSFLEFNIAHVSNAINMSYSKILKRRLQQDKLCATEFFRKTCNLTDVNITIIYDQRTSDVSKLEADSFLSVLMLKLSHVFSQVKLLQGGFENFHKNYPFLCEEKTLKCPPVSLSQPCLPVNSNGPTRILPFLYLGSQYDAMNTEILTTHNITYELNVSTNCPKSDSIPDGRFLRIPVNDNSSEKLYPHFPAAFQFIDMVRKVNGCVLIHCLAGISRSPAIAIAYIMKHLRLRSDDAYRYVKSKRATISPNFNFLGQLLEYENRLRAEMILDDKSTSNFRHRYNKTLHTPWSSGMSEISEIEPATTTTDKNELEELTPRTASITNDGTQPNHSTTNSTPINENLAKSLSTARSYRFCLKKSNSAYDLGCFNNMVVVKEPVKDLKTLEAGDNLNGVEGIPLSKINKISSTPCQVSYSQSARSLEMMDWTQSGFCNKNRFISPKSSRVKGPGGTNIFNSDLFITNSFRMHQDHIKAKAEDQFLVRSPKISSQNNFNQKLSLDPEQNNSDNNSDSGTKTEGTKATNLNNNNNNKDLIRKFSAHSNNTSCHQHLEKLHRTNSCPVIISFSRCTSLENFTTTGNLKEVEKPKRSSMKSKNSRRNCYSCGNLEQTVNGRSTSCFEYVNDCFSQVSVSGTDKAFASNVGAIRVS